MERWKMIHSASSSAVSINELEGLSHGIDEEPREPASTPRASTCHATADARFDTLPTRKLPVNAPDTGTFTHRLMRRVGMRPLTKPGDVETGRIPPTVSTDLATLHQSAGSPDTAALMTILADAFEHSATRAVNPEEAARLVNTYRRQRQSGGASLGVGQLTSAAASEAEHWYRAQGLTDVDVGKLRHAAFMSGLIYPSSGLAANLLQFFASPFLSAGTGKPWAGSGLGIGVAIGAQIPLNAFQQPVVVQFVEHTAERNGPVVNVDKAHINYQQWLPEISQRTSRQADALREQATRFKQQRAILAVQLGDQQHEPLDDGQLMQWLSNHADHDDAQRLRDTAQRVADAFVGLLDLHEKVLVTEAGHTRQHIGNRFQAPFRIARPVFQSLMGLASGNAASAAVGEALTRAARLSPLSIATVQALGALTFTGAQHYFAGHDEVAKVEYKNLLNLIFGDFFTDAGLKKIEAGELITEHDIEPAKLRKLIASPVQSLVKRTAKALDDVIDRAQHACDTVRGQAAQKQRVAVAQVQLTPEQQRELSAQQQIVDSTRMDRSRLEEGKFNELDRDGHAVQILKSNLASFWPGALRDSSRNMNGGELKTQLAQRAGQAGHMGVLGGAVSSSMGKFASAVAGGSSKESTAEIIGVASTSLVTGSVAAYSAGTTTTIKNYGREAEQKLNLKQQTLLGLFALTFDIEGRYRASAAHAETARSLDAAREQLEFVNHVLKAVPARVAVDERTAPAAPAPHD
jgi:hypothetical protein